MAVCSNILQTFLQRLEVKLIYPEQRRRAAVTPRGPLIAAGGPWLGPESEQQSLGQISRESRPTEPTSQRQSQ